MSYHFLLQGIFPTWGSNLHLLHWQGGSLPLSHLGSLVPRLCHSFRGCALLPSRLKRGMGVCSRSHRCEMLEAGAGLASLPDQPPSQPARKHRGPSPSLGEDCFVKICLVALSRRAGLATVEASGKGPAFSALTMTSLPEGCRSCRGETEDCSGAGGLGLARPGPLKDPGRTVAWAWCMCARVCVCVCVCMLCAKSLQSSNSL